MEAMATSGRVESGNFMRVRSETSLDRRDRRDLVAFSAIVGAFLAVTLWLAAHLGLYIDELYSLHTTSRGFRYALDQSLGFEQQPPLFFLALTAWRQLSHTDLFARLFSILCSTGTLLLVFDFARRRLPSLPAWLPPLALAINPFFLWTALDVRVYASIVLISAALISTFFDAFVDEGSWAKAIRFTIIAVAAIYTQYFIGSMFVGFGLGLLMLGPRKKLVPFALAMTVVVVAAFPLLTIVRGEFHDATLVQTAPLPLASRMLTATLSFAFPHPKLAPDKFFNAAYVALVLVSLGAIVAGARRSTGGRTAAALGILAAAVVACFLGLILVARAPLEMPRHITTLFVPIALFVLATIARIRATLPRRRALWFYTALLVLASLAQDAVTYRPPLANPGDWQRVGDYLNAHVAASEPIAVFDTEDALGVRHYYRGRARVVPLPHELDFEVFDRRAFAIRSPAQLAAAFPQPSDPTRRAWLVFGVTTCSIVEFGSSCSILDSYVDTHFDTLGERKFSGTVVRELRERSPQDVTNAENELHRRHAALRNRTLR